MYTTLMEIKEIAKNKLFGHTKSSFYYIGFNENIGFYLSDTKNDQIIFTINQNGDLKKIKEVI